VERKTESGICSPGTNDGSDGGGEAFPKIKIQKNGKRKAAVFTTAGDLQELGIALSLTLQVIGSRWWAGRDSLREQEKPEARKILVSRDESHQSAARFVSHRHCL
jgi:hypothetical protein